MPSSSSSPSASRPSRPPRRRNHDEPRPARARRRVDALEGQAGTLSPAAARELAQIEADFDREFPGLRGSPEVLKTWPIELVERFIQYECGPTNGPAARFYELRKRAAAR